MGLKSRLRPCPALPFFFPLPWRQRARVRGAARLVETQLICRRQYTFHMPTIILGGYGTFGSIIARELAASGIDVTIAGRDLHHAQESSWAERGDYHVQAGTSEVD